MSEFKREERYFVVKIKQLDSAAYDKLYYFLQDNNTPLIEHCVVVESHWPEYETVWGMIQDRVEGSKIA